MISLNHPEVQKWFEDAGQGRWRCKETGKIIQGAILEFYCSFGPGLNGLTHFGLPLTDEVQPKTMPRTIKSAEVFQGRVVIQKFERVNLAYDPYHVLDAPPGSSSVYLMHQTDFEKVW